MNISSQMQLFDLNFLQPIGHNSAAPRKEMAYHEYRENRFFSDNGLCSVVPVSPMRRSLRWKLQSENVYLPGSVSLYGFRSTHIQRKSQGHRSLPSRSESQTISYGYPEHCLTKQSGPCQRKPRLENLRRLRPSSDHNRKRSIRERRLRFGIEASRL